MTSTSRARPAKVDDAPPQARASKSARKREATSLQALGIELAALSDAEIDALELSDDLCTALKSLRHLSSHGALVRQRQYIGKLMRRIDSAPLLAMLEARKVRHDTELRRFQRIERWRDRLLSATGDGDDPVAGVLREFPTIDRIRLLEVLERARRERTERRPPSAARELFAFLRGHLA